MLLLLGGLYYGILDICKIVAKAFTPHDQLDTLLSTYVNSHGSELSVTTLRKCLQSVSTEEVYQLLTTVKNECGATAIHIAAQRDHSEVITCLLDSVAPEQRYPLVWIQTTARKTALLFSAHRRHVKGHTWEGYSVESALQIKILEIINNDCKTALDVALQHNNQTTADLLKQYRSAADKIDDEVTKVADINIVRRLENTRREVGENRKKMEDMEQVLQYCVDKLQSMTKTQQPRDDPDMSRPIQEGHRAVQEDGNYQQLPVEVNESEDAVHSHIYA